MYKGKVMFIIRMNMNSFFFLIECPRNSDHIPYISFSAVINQAIEESLGLGKGEGVRAEKIDS